jgi:glycosyltransferase involved in cell wall biosynthesis
MEMIRYDVSCIMPVYNTEKYVKDALLSILKQKGGPKLQIITIDDGSTDNSVAVIKKLQQTYKNIELFQQENQGPAVARNFAMRKARGKYIMFVDSDDLLPVDAIEKLYINIKSNESEIAVGMFQAFNRRRTWMHKSMKYFVGVHKKMTNLEDFPELINNMSPWNKIYLRNFILDNKLHFLEGVHLREDIYFVCSALYQAASITVIPDTVYLYRGRDEDRESLTTRINKKVFQDIFLVSEKLDSEQKASSFAGNEKVWRYRYINELHAMNYRLWPFVQENSDVNDTLFKVQAFLQKVGNSTISYFPINERAVLYKIKNHEFAIAQKLIKDAKTGKRSLVSKIKDKVYIYLKNKFWQTANLIAPMLYHSKIAHSNFWLIGEQKGNVANDTGYQFFSYCRKAHPQKPVYFVTKKENITDEMRENLDRIIIYGSLKNYLFALRADVYIFSDGYQDIFAYWQRIEEHSRMRFAVFLQHGVFAFKRSAYYRSDEVASRQERFDMIVVSSEKEKNYVSEDFGYPAELFAVTGLSRFDRLYRDRNNKPGRTILFVPTWRYDLRYADDRQYLESVFHKKISEFIESPALQKMLEEYGYEMHICFHHAAAGFAGYYRSSSLIHFSNMDSVGDFHELLVSSRMLITDYSSVAFNMAYIDRPVSFYQWDTEEFLVVEGGSFIDFETELFGVASSDPGRIVEEIEYNIINGFKVRPEFQKKADLFFDHKDDHNCERIFKAIEAGLMKEAPHLLSPGNNRDRLADAKDLIDSNTPKNLKRVKK